MEIKKRTEIRSMEYGDFRNNDYLERMVDELNRDGAGDYNGYGRRADKLGKEQLAVVTHLRYELLRHRVYGPWSRTL